MYFSSSCKIICVQPLWGIICSQLLWGYSPQVVRLFSSQPLWGISPRVAALFLRTSSAQLGPHCSIAYLLFSQTRISCRNKLFCALDLFWPTQVPSLYALVYHSLISPLHWGYTRMLSKKVNTFFFVTPNGSIQVIDRIRKIETLLLSLWLLKISQYLMARLILMLISFESMWSWQPFHIIASCLRLWFISWGDMVSPISCLSV